MVVATFKYQDGKEEEKEFKTMNAACIYASTRVGLIVFYVKENYPITNLVN